MTRDHRRNIVHNDGVGAFIGDHIATLRDELLASRDQIFGVGVAQEAGEGDFVHRQGFSFMLGAAGVGFMAKRIDRRNAQHVAVELPCQIVVLQDDIECLVPRHIVEHNGQRPLHVGIEHHVQPADFVNQAEEVFQVDIFQVDRNRLTRVLRLGCGDGLSLGLLRLLFGSQVHGWLNWGIAGAAGEFCGCMAALGVGSRLPSGLSTNLAAASTVRAGGSRAGVVSPALASGFAL